MKIAPFALAGMLATMALSQATAQTLEMSAVRKNSPFVTYIDPYTGEKMTVYRKTYLVPSNDFEGGDFPGNYALRKAEGRCVIDLGYGRHQFCN